MLQTTAPACPNLFSPVTLGKLTLPNRALMGSMHTGLEERPTLESLAAFHAERVRGGVGLITMELITVDETHRYMHRSMTLGNDRFIDDHRRITN